MRVLISEFYLFDYILYTTSNSSVTVGDLLKFVFILSLSILLSKILTLYLRRSLKDKVSKDVGETFLKILYYGTLVVVFISILPLIGLDPSGLLLAGGITGIILGFASQNIVGNLVSGFFLMVERPIKIGDQVQINDISGYVTDIRIISTLIRTYDGLLVRIPNQQVFTTNITNIVGHPVRRFEWTIGIRYCDDADATILIITDLIDKEPFALQNPEPSVFVNELAESSVKIIIRMWAPVSEWFRIKTKLLWAIKQALEQNGIEIAYPRSTIYLQKTLEKIQLPEKQTQEKEIECILNYEERVLS